MARTLTTQDVTWFLDLQEKGQLNLDPPYQRRSVWSPRDKRFFIDTIMNDYPAPPVFLHKVLDENGRSTYHVVDGKQRLETIIDFTQNRVRVPDDFIDIGLQKKRWRDLDRSAKEKFWNYAIIVEMLPDVSDSAIRNIFERINRNSRKLTPQEMRHAKYDGWFINFVEKESEKLEWRNFGVVTTARIKRMIDVQFISELCAVMLKGSIVGFDQDMLDDIYAEYDDVSDIGDFLEDEFIENVETTKGAISQILAHDEYVLGYIKTQGDFFSLWAHLYLENHRGLDVSAFCESYRKFMGSVRSLLNTTDVSVEEEEAMDSNVREYARHSRGASTDLTPRLARHVALTKALHGSENDSNEDC